MLQYAYNKQLSNTYYLSMQPLQSPSLCKVKWNNDIIGSQGCICLYCRWL